MIKYLDGSYEKCDYEEMSQIVLYDNVELTEYPNHWHSSMEIIMPMEKEYHVECGSDIYDLREGDILLIEPGTLHHLLASPGRRLIFQSNLSVLNNLCALDDLYAMMPSAVCVTPESFPRIYDQVHRKMLEIYNIYFSNQQLRELQITSEVLQILIMLGAELAKEKPQAPRKLSAQKTEQYQRIMNMSQYVSAHCMEDLNLESVAEHAGFSMYHFERIFKEHTGYSFYKYLNRCRIRRAEMLMSDPQISITDVAMQSGFKSISSFIRMFKIVNGCTPSEFKNMKRK